MSTLLVAEHDNRVLNINTLNMVNAALQLGEPLTVLVIGSNCLAVAQAAAIIKGVGSVIHIDNLQQQHKLAENFSDAVTQVAREFSYLLAPASTFGKNFLPRVAANLDVAQISDVTKIINKKTFEHPIYAGNALEVVESLDAIIVLTVRSTAFDPVLEKQQACLISCQENTSSNNKSVFIKTELSRSSRPSLADAQIVVSGGRGLQNAEKFKLIEELADHLGAAVGASRAAVDAGFVANDYQVGQTGKIIAPNLYIAIGISGAIQHIAGMKEAKIIVAINKDEDAPIFQIATYGLVGDLFELVPQLISELKNIT